MQISYIINSHLLRQKIKTLGFKSIHDFATTIGVHRNTVSDYLNSKAKPLPDGLEKILNYLGLHPKDALLEHRLESFQYPEQPILPLIDELVTACPEAAFVLYGSRARGTEKKYSDFDIGLYTIKPIPFSLYSSLLDKVDCWNEANILSVQLTNLNNADQYFLTSISKDIKFIGGKPKAWEVLLKGSDKLRYEK
ncbi:helix-turn-helix domain-containing protein [bacterium]|nr:helix-turn-helix domain-containing protein [bacterium]